MFAQLLYNMSGKSFAAATSDKIQMKSQENAKQLLKFHREHLFFCLEVYSQKFMIMSPMVPLGKDLYCAGAAAHTVEHFEDSYRYPGVSSGYDARCVFKML